jgi:hypothetical protein
MTPTSEVGQRERSAVRHGHNEVKYFVTAEGALQEIPVACDDVFSLHNPIAVDASVVQAARKLAKLPAQFCDSGRLYQASNSRSVYLLGEDRLVHEFQSAEAFLSRGMDFDRVNKIDPLLMALFRTGTVLS